MAPPGHARGQPSGVPALQRRRSQAMHRTLRLLEATMMFLDCPAYLDQDGAAPCGLPTEVTCRFITCSADGPIECAMIRCPAGQWFGGDVQSLTLHGSDRRDRGTARAPSSVSRDNLTGDHDRPHVERDVPRPNSASACHLSRPA